jgi:hypothetical protein
MILRENIGNSFEMKARTCDARFLLTPAQNRTLCQARQTQASIGDAVLASTVDIAIAGSPWVLDAIERLGCDRRMRSTRQGGEEWWRKDDNAARSAGPGRRCGIFDRTPS